MRRLGGLVVIFLLTVLCSVSHAQLLIEQGKLAPNIFPGDTQRNTVAVHNTSDRTVNVRAYWEDFVYVEPFDGKKEFMPAGTSEFSASEWISFSPREFTLPPFGKIDIAYTIKVPRNARGGHYGVLFVEQSLGNMAAQTGVKVIARVGSLFFLETKKSKVSEVSDFKSDGQALQGTFTNQGNLFLIPEGIYYFLDSRGIVAARGKTDKFYLPPNKQKSFTIQIPEDLPPAKYSCVLTFDLGEGKSVVKEIPFSWDKDSAVTLLDKPK